MWNHGYSQGWMGFDGAGWSWFMGLHGLLWLLFVVLTIAVLVALTRHLWRWGSDSSTDANSALATLEGRYAQGEIERDEYLQKRDDLTGHRRHFRRRHGPADPKTA